MHLEGITMCEETGNSSKEITISVFLCGNVSIALLCFHLCNAYSFEPSKPIIKRKMYVT